MKSSIIRNAVLPFVLVLSPWAAAEGVAAPPLGATAEESAHLSSGWSRRSVLGSGVFNDAGDRIGTVEDLVIDLGSNASFLILDASDFVDIVGFQVAVPTTQIREKSGRIWLAAATREAVAAMPRFRSATVAQRHDRLVESAKLQIAQATADLAGLSQTVSAAEARKPASGRLSVAEKYLRQSNTAYAAMTAADPAASAMQEHDLRKALSRLQRAMWNLKG